jgi:signal transduction histidine kinase
VASFSIASSAVGRARFDVEQGIKVSPETREALLRIGREAVTNASRHGRADMVSVELENSNGIRLRIADNGIGFDPAALNGEPGFGLTEVEVVIP